MGYDADPMYCGKCRTALARGVLDGVRTSYIHQNAWRGQTFDHEPVPVRLAELTDGVQMDCDFCSEPGPTWIYVADERTDRYRKIVSETVGQRDYRDRHNAARVVKRKTADTGNATNWGERWSACEPCAEYIEKRDVLGLTGRVVDRLPARLTRGRRLIEARGQVMQMYEHLFATLCPGRGRITPDNPLGVWEEA